MCLNDGYRESESHVLINSLTNNYTELYLHVPRHQSSEDDFSTR